MSTVFQNTDALDNEIFPSVQASQGKSSKSDVKDVKNENNPKSDVKDVRDDMVNIKKEDDSVDDSIEFNSIGKVVFSSHHFIALIASGDKLVRFDIGRNRLVSPIRAGYRISCVAIDELAGQIVTCGGFNFTIWTISGGYLYNQVCGVKVSQVAVANLPIYVQNRFIVTGHVDGFLLFWTFDSKLGVIQNLAQKKVTSQPITAIAIDESSMRVVASNKENEVFCLDFPGTERSPINRDFAYECPSCKKPFEVSKSASNRNIVNFVSKGNVKVCSKCHRYFCRDCVTALPRRIIQMTNKDYICEFCASLGAK